MHFPTRSSSARRSSTINPHAAKFISRYGCPEYFAHNKELLFYERKQDIIAEVERMDLDE